MTTLKDISKACNVSLATVSKALNGQPDISEATATMIKLKAKELGYLPNSAARSLKTNKSHNIGLLFVDKTASGLNHEYFSSILNSIKDEVELHGYDVTFISKGIGNSAMNYYEHAKYRHCDGVIIASVDFKDPDVIQLVESEIPTVTLDYVFNNRTSVLSDNIEGVSQLVRYVYSKGHRKIAMIHGEMTAVTRKRLTSFLKTCYDLNITVPDEYVKEAIYHDPKSSALMTRALMELDDRPTCILYPDDFSYIGGKNELDKQGLTVYEDISVCGYDGIYLSQVMRPSLTTYRQNSDQMGREAAKRLINEIEHPKIILPEVVSVSGELIEGNTVKDISS